MGRADRRYYHRHPCCGGVKGHCPAGAPSFSLVCTCFLFPRKPSASSFPRPTTCRFYAKFRIESQVSGIAFMAGLADSLEAKKVVLEVLTVRTDTGMEVKKMQDMTAADWGRLRLARKAAPAPAAAAAGAASQLASFHAIFISCPWHFPLFFYPHRCPQVTAAAAGPAADQCRTAGSHGAAAGPAALDCGDRVRMRYLGAIQPEHGRDQASPAPSDRGGSAWL